MSLQDRVPQWAKTPILLTWHLLAIASAIIYAVDRIILLRLFLRRRGLGRWGGFGKW